MQNKIFRQNEGRKEKGISLLFVLSFLLLSCFIFFSLTGCGGGGGGSSSASDGPIGPALFSGWEMTKGPFSGSISSLTVDSANSGVLYSISGKKEVYKSTDEGISWTYFPIIDSQSQENIRAQQLEIAATDNQLYYLGTGSQGMYKSTNGGETWVHTSNGLPENQYGYLSVDQIVIDPSDHDTAYARLDMGYMIYKTLDGGQNWFKINDQSADLTPVQDLLIDPQNNQTLYIGLWHYVSSEPHPEKGGIWKSTNGGLNWLQMCGNYPLCLPKDIYGNWVRVNELAMGSQGNPRVYAGTDYCKCGSDDGGENWGMIEIVGIPVQDHQRITALEIDPNDEKTIYVGVEDQDNWDLSGLWVTTDGGWNWTQYFPYTFVGSIEIGPSDSTVFAASDSGLVVSYDLGENWEV
ncbi:MAG: WD40/YVTN/BNR-like repeat-containing protein, partial [Promethearchaeota archaeon]